MVKNPPANAGDTGSSSGPERSHMLWSNWARDPQLLKPACLEPMLCNKRKVQSMKEKKSIKWTASNFKKIFKIQKINKQTSLTYEY